MKTQRYLLLLSIICISFLLVKCGKDGAIGPQGTPGGAGTPGATGSAGTKGATGPAGPTGAQGTEGNANVKVDVFTVNTADWTLGTTYMVEFGGATTGYFTKHFDRNNSLITATLLNSGEVLVYFQPDATINAVQWQPLPFSIDALDIVKNIDDEHAVCHFAYETFEGKVRLHFYLSKASGIQPKVDNYNIPTRKFKILVVSGTLLGAIRQNHINVNNYNEVSRFLGI